MGLRNGLKRLLSKWLTPKGDMPLEAFQRKIMRDGQIAARIKDAEQKGKMLNKMLSGFKGNKAKLKEAVNRILHDSEALRDPVFMESLQVMGVDPDIIALAETMRAEMDTMSREILAEAEKAGIEGLSEGVQAAIKNNLGVYVHRSYRAFSDKNWHKKQRKNLPVIIRAAEMFKK